MNRIATHYPDEFIDSGKNLLVWRVLQVGFWLAGVGVIAALLFFPGVGIHALWNLLIPVAPALLVLSTGVWRNICPLGTTSLLPRHFGFSKSKRLPVVWQARFQLGGVILFFLIVPLRHCFFDTDGKASAFLLIAIAILAFTSGYFFEWKSGWCSGLCPVHPVEKLYGANVAYTPANAHCRQCANCVIPCPDSTARPVHLKTNGNTERRIAQYLLAGGLPGFIWGWFHVQDRAGGFDWYELARAYTLPAAGMLCTLMLFAIVSRAVPAEKESVLLKFFAASAVSCYYWYRIPALLGFGLFPGDGMLVDVSQEISRSFIYCLQIAAAGFFYYWLMYHPQERRIWAIRPPFARVKKSDKNGKLQDVSPEEASRKSICDVSIR